MIPAQPAFGAHTVRWLPWIYRTARKWETNLARFGLDRDDAAQEAVLAALEAERDYNPAHGAFPPFAAVCIRSDLSKLATRERCAKRRPARDPLSLDAPLLVDGDGTRHDVVPAEAPSPEDEAARTEARQHVRAALARLPASQADLLQRWAEGESMITIAQGLGITRQAVHLRITAARRLLEAEIQTSKQTFVW